VISSGVPRPGDAGWCLTRAPAIVQRSFEERLGRQLGEMEAAIRRDISFNAKQLEAKLSRLADLVAGSQCSNAQAQSKAGDGFLSDESDGDIGQDLGPSCDELSAVGEGGASKQSLDSGKLQEMGVKLDHVNKILEHVATAVGVRTGLGAGDEEEDHRRLKEKLKEALERDRRDRIREVVSEREVWLEYVFGICKPDRRTGRRGSRYGAVQLGTGFGTDRPREHRFAFIILKVGQSEFRNLTLKLREEREGKLLLHGHSFNFQMKETQ
jgi:hypothetical protein